MLALVTLISAAHASEECPLPIPAAMFQLKLDDVQTSIQQKNLAQLSQKMEDLNSSLPCVAEPFSTAQASQYHMLIGVTEWIGKDINLAQLHFSAAKATKEDAAIPVEMFPEGHQIQDSFSRSPVLEKTKSVGAPSEGALYFDGEQGLERPVFTPTLFQHVVGDEAKRTGIIGPKDPLPGYGAVAAAAKGPDKAPEELQVPEAAEAKGNEPSRSMLIGGIGAGAASALLYGAAFAAQTIYVSGSTPEDLAEREDPEAWARQLEKLNTGAVWGSIAGGGASAVMLTLHFTGNKE